jgi:light-regulated signal transduction histidine kinase (bacteriophytochrome)
MNEEQLRSAYSSALLRYMSSGSDDDLVRAEQLGQSSLEGGLDSSAVVLAHFKALVGKEAPSPEAEERSQHFLIAAIRPFAATRHRYEEITEELALLSDALILRSRELEIANADLEAFSFSVSHDLRTSLQTVSGFAQTLAAHHWDELSPEAQRYLDLILRSASGMNELIGNLLELARASRLPIEREMIDLGTVVEETMDELAPEIASGGTEVVVGQLPVVDGDPVLLKRVLVNLLSNAIKFSATKPRARVEIDFFEQDGERGVMVHDNGVGFDMKHSERLFHPFERLHRRDEYEGTGIGLALVARIIDRHGGRVWAESEPGQGATFYFTVGGREAPSGGSPDDSVGARGRTTRTSAG